MDIAASQPSLLLVVALSGKCYDGQTELSREKKRRLSCAPPKSNRIGRNLILRLLVGVDEKRGDVMTY